MIPKEYKRLAEVDFPIAVVSKHSAREKSIRYGPPSTLHRWWARRLEEGLKTAQKPALSAPRDVPEAEEPEEMEEQARERLEAMLDATLPQSSMETDGPH